MTSSDAARVSPDAPWRDGLADDRHDALPRSATHAIVAAVAAIAFLATLAFVVVVRPFAHDAVPSAMLVIAITTVAIFAVEPGRSSQIHALPSELDGEYRDDRPGSTSTTTIRRGDAR